MSCNNTHPFTIISPPVRNVMAIRSKFESRVENVVFELSPDASSLISHYFSSSQMHLALKYGYSLLVLVFVLRA